MSKNSRAPLAKGAEQKSPEREGRERKIAVAAYYRAERRGFKPGHELEDWLAAEAEIEGRLERRGARARRSGL